MDEQKKELIARLYALRGGLSILSEIHDEARIVGKKIIELKSAIYQKKKEQEEATEEKESEKRSCSHEIEYTQKYIDDRKQDLHELEEKKQKLTRKLKRSKWIPRILTLNVILIIISLVFSMGEEPTESTRVVIMGCICAVGGWFLGPIFLISTICTHETRGELKDEIRYTRKKIEDCNDDITIYKRSLITLEDNYESKLIEIERAYDEELVEANREVEELEQELNQKNEEMQEIRTRFSVAHQAMQKEFSGFLDERDWGNVDLIIFNYETGRALDMRDALIQVDNERRNERLIRAIQEASRAIAASFSSSIASLQTSLESHFTRLNNRITTDLAKIAESSSRQTKLLDRQLGQLAEISSAHDALMRKITTSSDTMVKDVEIMRDLSEKTYYNAFYLRPNR